MATNGGLACQPGSEPQSQSRSEPQGQSADTPAYQEIRYSKNAWKIDGTFLYQLAEEINDGNFADIRPLLRQLDVAAAKAIMRLMDLEKREDY
jgi:hypothetical protein